MSVSQPSAPPVDVILQWCKRRKGLNAEWLPDFNGSGSSSLPQSIKRLTAEWLPEFKSNPPRTVIISPHNSPTQLFHHTVSQEQFWPITKPTRNFIFDIILRQPYTSEYDNPQNICLGLFEFSPPPWGENHLSLKIVCWNLVRSQYFVINLPESALYTSLGVYINQGVSQYSPVTLLGGE